MNIKFNLATAVIVFSTFLFIGCGDSSSDTTPKKPQAAASPATGVLNQPSAQTQTTAQSNCVSSGGNWTGTECKICSPNQYYDQLTKQCLISSTASTNATMSSTSMTSTSSSSSNPLTQLLGLLQGAGGGTSGINLNQIKSLLGSLPSGDLSQLMNSCPIIQGLLNGSASQSDLQSLLGNGNSGLLNGLNNLNNGSATTNTTNTNQNGSNGLGDLSGLIGNCSGGG